MPLEQAVVDAGAVRFRPMALTAAAVIVGAGVILFDPIFQGLAISLMAGEVASLLLSRMTVPILYFISARRGGPDRSGSERDELPIGAAMKKILVPVDFNALATSALKHAALFAQQTGASLIVMYADTFEPPAEFTATQMATLAGEFEDSRNRTAEELDRYAHENVPAKVMLQTEVREALPVAGILRAVEEHRPDLLVMGTHGRGGLARLVYGSVTEAVLRDALIPVLTINHAGAAHPPQNILCVATGHERSDALRRTAGELAAIFGVPCRHVQTSRESAMSFLASPEAVAAGLMVMSDEIPALTRHAAVPVLHVRDAW